MELPEKLDTWTYETVLEVVRAYEYEPARIDFKEVLTPEYGTTDSRKGHTESIRRTMCGMANTDGGYILFGVADREKQVLSPEVRIQGIPRRTDLRKQLADKLEDVQPAVTFDLHVVELPTDPARVVAIVYVPVSPLRPHQCVTAERFYRRSAGGKAVAMNVYEVRDQTLFSSQRMRQLTLFRLELHALREIREALRNPDLWFVRFDATSFKQLLADIWDLLPEDGQLPSTLHGIATMAVQFNHLLEFAFPLYRRARLVPRFVPGSPKLTLDENMQHQLDLFDATCAQAMAMLAACFGPLRITTVVLPGMSSDKARAQTLSTERDSNDEQ